jgi:putative Holliday junction resolvase
MRVLGLDVGERRIGVAISDDLGIAAGRLTTLDRRGLKADLDALCGLIVEHQVCEVAVGLPLTLRGEHGIQAQRVSGFVEQLRRRTDTPIHLVDERLTTVQGARALIATGASARKRKAVVDQVAAQLILQHYLDAHR